MSAEQGHLTVMAISVPLRHDHIKVGLLEPSETAEPMIIFCIGYKNIPVNFGGAPKVPDSGK